MILAIVKYIAVHKSPKNFLRYIMNSDKTEEMKFVTGLNCTADLDYAYNQMSNVFEKYAKERFCKKSIISGKEKIRLHHYIQSFKPEEVSSEEAHKIGVEWAEKVFGRDHQVLVTTHVDKNHNLHNVTYSELRRNAELLTYLCDNKIRSEEDFQNVVNAAAEKSEKLKKSREKLLQGIEERENILKDGARYIELNSIKMPTAVQLEELVKLNHLTKFNLRSEADIESHEQELERLKSELSETEKSLDVAEMEKSTAAANYKTYLRQMQSDYDFVLEKMRREQEEIKLAEQNLQREQELTVRVNQQYYR